MSFDAIIQRLQNIEPFNIHKINADGTTEPWFRVTGNLIIPELVLNEYNLLEQLQTVTGRIATWGRYTAQAKRVWSIKEREYRIWRSTMYLCFRNDGEKRTEKETDALIRTHPDYHIMYARSEQAEEAYESTKIITTAWKAKQDIMKSALYRRNTENGAVLSL